MYQSLEFMNKFSRIFPFLLTFTIAVYSCSNDEEEEKNENTKEDDNMSNAYVSDLIDYQYGPGQHIALLKNCPPENILGQQGSNILLGGWGGYIAVGFNHDIQNEDGEDLIIFCGTSVSPEPGIIYVMEDQNKNGKPDDEWYEIRGSEYYNKEYIRNYKVTYYAPNLDTTGLVTWKDNQGAKGVLPNSATWWWAAGKDSVSFSGSRLPTAYFNSPTTDGTQYWAVFQDLFRYGYAENGLAPDRTATNGWLSKDFDSELKGNKVELDSAMDAQGNLVHLSSIRFVKVQTGVFQQAGWLGEISTEITGIADLRMLKNQK